MAAWRECPRKLRPLDWPDWAWVLIILGEFALALLGLRYL